MVIVVIDGDWWWLMMIYSDLWWVMVIDGDYWWLTDGDWWFIVIHSHNDFWWLLVIDSDSWWFHEWKLGLKTEISWFNGDVVRPEWEMQTKLKPKEIHVLYFEIMICTRWMLHFFAVIYIYIYCVYNDTTGHKCLDGGVMDLYKHPGDLWYIWRVAIPFLTFTTMWY